MGISKIRFAVTETLVYSPNLKLSPTQLPRCFTACSERKYFLYIKYAYKVYWCTRRASGRCAVVLSGLPVKFLGNSIPKISGCFISACPSFQTADLPRSSNERTGLSTPKLCSIRYALALVSRLFVCNPSDTRALHGHFAQLSIPFALAWNASTQVPGQL